MSDTNFVPRVTRIVSTWLQDINDFVYRNIGASGGSALVGFLPSGIGAITTGTVQGELRRFVWAEQYGAVGDGVTDCTTAFVNAFAVSKHVLVGAGTFLADTVALVGNGFILEGSGTGVTIIKGRNSSCTKIVDIHGSSSFATDNQVKNLTLDMANMTDASTRKALFLDHTYNNLIEKVNVVNVGGSKISLALEMSVPGNGIYTTRFVGCDFESSAGKINIAGTSVNDAITTISFDDCQFGRCTIDGAISIRFRQPTVQGTLNKFVLSNCFNIDILGGDVEGTGTYLAIGANVSFVQSVNNNISAALTYSSGTALNSLLQDRVRGWYGKANGKPSLSIGTTGATAIYTFTDVSSVPTWSAALMVISGDDGTRGWTDLILFSYGISPVTISSNNVYGAGQPTRTYTYSAGSVLITLSAVAANNVRVLTLEYMGG